jgi:DoxX
MTSSGAPAPTLAAIVAVVMEFIAGIALAVGFWTRPLALLMALYTLGTALIGHHCWTMTGGARDANLINFYKNAWRSAAPNRVDQAAVAPVRRRGAGGKRMAPAGAVRPGFSGAGLADWEYPRSGTRACRPWCG